MKAIIVHAKYRAPHTRENKKQTERFIGGNGKTQWDEVHDFIDRLLLATGKVKLTIETE